MAKELTPRKGALLGAVLCDTGVALGIVAGSLIKDHSLLPLWQNIVANPVPPLLAFAGTNIVGGIFGYSTVVAFTEKSDISTF